MLDEFIECMTLVKLKTLSLPQLNFVQMVGSLVFTNKEAIFLMEKGGCLVLSVPRPCQNRCS